MILFAFLKWLSPVRYTPTIYRSLKKPQLYDLHNLVGYAFESAEAILPYLETPRTGPTSAFCKELASRLGCYVAAGYPERLAEEELTIESSGAAEVSLESDTEQEDAFKGESVIESTEVAEPLSDPIRPTPVGANSAIIYGPSGEWVGGYRKTNLFFTDMTWAKPGRQ